MSPLVANLFYTFAQSREELAGALDGLTTTEIWSRPHGLASVGFHIRHMGGAAERLACYLAGSSLSPAQLADLNREPEPGASPGELLDELSARLDRVEKQVREMNPADLNKSREVGRAKLPSTAIGLIVHIAEHTQRHLGQAVTMAKLVRALRRESTAEQRA